MKKLFKAIIEYFKNPPRTTGMGPFVTQRRPGDCDCCKSAKVESSPR
jgi:hypothetical protein